MLKKYALILLGIAMIVFLASCEFDTDEQYKMEYCKGINELLKTEEFDTAKIDAGDIVLFDSKKEVIKTLDFPEYDESVDIIYIRKRSNVIYFTTEGAVDDEEGYMFINGEENRIFDGLWSIERVDGNGYAYSTAK